jgi:hypothetical protein
MEPRAFRHRLAAFAAEANRIAPTSVLGFSRSTGGHRTSFVYWYPVGIGGQVMEGPGVAAIESLLRFFGAARIVSWPLTDCAQPTSVWIGLTESEPRSAEESAAIEALARGRRTGPGWRGTARVEAR